MTDIIPNGTGAEVRAAINTELSKLEISSISLNDSQGKQNPILTSDSSNGCTTIYSNTANYWGSEAPYRVFNNSIKANDSWCFESTSGTTSDFVGLILPEVHTYTSCIIWGEVSNPLARTWQDTDIVYIEGSNDTTIGTDGTWNTIHTITQPASKFINPGVKPYLVVTSFLDASSYKAYRLKIQRNRTSSQRFLVVITEWQLFESSVPFPVNPVNGQTVFDKSSLKTKVFYNGQWY